MNDTLCRNIEENPSFQALVKKRSRFAWLLSLITLTLYVSFIFLIAFAPQWLGTPLSVGYTITRGIPIGVGLIVTSFILTGVYVYRANGEFDRLNAEVLRGVQQ